MFSSATQPPPPPPRSPPPRHNVVSAITFEGFKLLSSNLTHALLIQISRTSCVSIWNGQKCDRKLFADIQNGCQRPFCQQLKKLNKVPYGYEMARNAIESEFRTSKMADQSEMARNAIQSDFQTSKMAIESEFRKSKMAVSIWNGQKCDRKWISDIQNDRRKPFCQKFIKKLKLLIDLKWPEMRSKMNFGHPKWPTVSHFVKNF